MSSLGPAAGEVLEAGDVLKPPPSRKRNRSSSQTRPTTLSPIEEMSEPSKSTISATTPGQSLSNVSLNPLHTLHSSLPRLTSGDTEARTGSRSNLGSGTGSLGSMPIFSETSVDPSISTVSLTVPVDTAGQGEEGEGSLKDVPITSDMAVVDVEESLPVHLWSGGLPGAVNQDLDPPCQDPPHQRRKSRQSRRPSLAGPWSDPKQS